ncbi:hypothetical protein CFOL_v3_28019 [Cephalotus follicularis]|uniref:Uncharacterized protein n=1 Tax=Cephalotus follicularis TaxID=3775 RepID=A0A1Q3CWM4_CEPFO|nr:hypothetical protein CFOL_v3_28019 [Cephalotus follicularis]
MATKAESPDEKHPPSPQHNALPTVTKLKSLDEVAPWIDYALQQAVLYQKAIGDTIDSTFEASRSRLSQIRSTFSSHSQTTIESMKDVKAQYEVYEDMLFGKVKESVNVAASHPLITGGAVVGLGLLVLKRPRRLLYYNTLQLFWSEEALLSKADTKVKELRQSISLLKAESEKLERRASLAEEELIRGRKKLRQAGKQIRGVIHSAYKIERQAGGLKDVIRGLPGRDASRFRSLVSKLASEARQERNALTKEVSKISNYGIAV